MQVFHWNLSRLGTAAGDWYCMTRSEMVFPLEDFCWTGLWKNWIKLKGSAGGHAPVPDSGTSSGYRGMLSLEMFEIGLSERQYNLLHSLALKFYEKKTLIWHFGRMHN